MTFINADVAEALLINQLISWSASDKSTHQLERFFSYTNCSAALITPAGALL